MPNAALFINAASNIVIAKKKARIAKDTKERFRRKARVKERAPTARRNSRIKDSNRIVEIILNIELNPNKEEPGT